MKKIEPGMMPDILTTLDGVKITDKESWESKRRPEIVEFFTRNVYGSFPPRPEEMSFTVREHDDQALGGSAVQDTVEIAFKGPFGRYAFELYMFLPKQNSPCPMAVLICNRDKHENMDLKRKNRTGFWPVEAIVNRGWGTCAYFTGDVDTDEDDGFVNGVHHIFTKERGSHDWATISAWAWAALRVMDYLETDRRVDSNRITLTGQSRGGKTALYAGMWDTRYQAVFSSCSGCVGAALSRVKKGETIRMINEVFPYWFCDAFKQYNDHEFCMPMDQDALLASIAPRLLYVTSATEDDWADPDAEFAAAKLAGAVYKLYGTEGLPEECRVIPDQPIHGGRVGYHRRMGIHDLTEFDWKLFLDFVENRFGK